MRVSRAMVLAAGLGKRMMPLTRTVPKPLIPVLGRTMLDRHLDRLADAGIATCVVNVHHLAGAIRAHLRDRTRPAIRISDETGALLDTGGGVARALPLLGPDPFFVLNGDVVWDDGAEPALSRLARGFDPATLDAAILLVPRERASGYDGPGDFALDDAGRPRRRGGDAAAPFVFAGVQIVHPRLLDGAPAGAFSMNLAFDRAIAAGRLGAVIHDGAWYHVGTPDAIAATEARMRAAARKAAP